MGLFNKVISKVTGALGMTGGAESGGRAAGELRQIAQGIRDFRPVRIRDIRGTGVYGPDGVSFEASPEYAARQRDIGDFFGQATGALARYNPETAEADTLAMLRRQSGRFFDTNLSRLESRLQAQGRIGLATGPSSANPELEGFFSAAGQTDLMAQLQAKEEARRRGSFLMQQAGAAGGMYNEMANPFASGLFQFGQLDLGRNLGAANIETQGVQAQLAGERADQSARASFFTSLIGGLTSPGGSK